MSTHSYKQHTFNHSSNYHIFVPLHRFYRFYLDEFDSLVCKEFRAVFQVEQARNQSGGNPEIIIRSCHSIFQQYLFLSLLCLVYRCNQLDILADSRIIICIKGEALLTALHLDLLAALQLDYE